MNSQDSQQPAGNPYEQIAQGAQGKRGQIDPELLPYLVEADREEKIELPISDASADPRNRSAYGRFCGLAGLLCPMSLLLKKVFQGEAQQEDAEAPFNETAVAAVSPMKPYRQILRSPRSMPGSCSGAGT